MQPVLILSIRQQSLILCQAANRGVVDVLLWVLSPLLTSDSPQHVVKHLTAECPNLCYIETLPNQSCYGVRVHDVTLCMKYSQVLMGSKGAVMQVKSSVKFEMGFMHQNVRGVESFLQTLGHTENEK